MGERVGGWVGGRGEGGRWVGGRAKSGFRGRGDLEFGFLRIFEKKTFKKFGVGMRGSPKSKLSRNVRRKRVEGKREKGKGRGGRLRCTVLVQYRVSCWVEYLGEGGVCLHVTVFGFHINERIVSLFNLMELLLIINVSSDYY